MYKFHKERFTKSKLAISSFGICNLHSTRTKATFMKNKGDRYPVCPFVSISCMFYWTVNWGLKYVGHSVQMLTRSDRSRTVHGSLVVDKNTFNWILRKWGWNFFCYFFIVHGGKTDIPCNWVNSMETQYTWVDAIKKIYS